MDFFQQQDAARHRTGWLVLLFILAVAAIVLAVYAVFAAVAGKPWEPRLFFAVSLGTVTVIAAGSLYKIAELASGGEAVALMLGGRLVDPSTRDLAERRLLNVVEEMALASGIPVPPVYVLDRERSINAFAAGHTPQGAVIGVSRGSLDYLTRDELQGVMGHEFSHILNGDMRLNLRLIGLLNGILLVAMLGYYVLRFAPSSNDSDSKGGAAGVFVIGLGLLVIGSVGLFFAKLIRSCVSRQREYLADASAVQFTRYPGGIAGALKKIGGLSEASRIRDAHAQEVSHLFFGDAFAGSLFNLFATHPPLAERIRRIDPAFDGTFPETQPPGDEDQTPAVARPDSGPQSAGGMAEAVVGLAATADAIHAGSEAVVDRIGTLAPEQLSYATALIEQMPERLKRAASEPFGARAVVYAVLLGREEDVRKRQLAAIQGRTDEACYREMAALIPLVDQLCEEARLPLVDRTAPALKQLSPRQYADFRETVDVLVKADGKIELLEYAIQTMLFRTLDIHFGLAKPSRIQYYSLEGALKPAVAAVLSTLAYAGQANREEAQRAYDAGMKQLGQDAAMLPKDRCTLASFDAALTELAKSAPKAKRLLVGGCAACIAADGKVVPREAELLRAITSTLGCPMPPMAAVS